MNKGITLILLGYIGWGLFPLYWSSLKHVLPTEVLAHRMLWSVPVLIIFVVLVKAWRNDFFTAFKDKKELRWLFFTAILITINWGVYVVAVNQERVVEASLGYFLSPLLQVLSGLLIFKEKIDRFKKTAILCAALGVLYYISSVNTFPWIGLVVGFTFASYGVLRKMIKTPAVPGLLVETLLLIPLSLAYIIFLGNTHEASFLHSTLSTDVYLILGGLVTVIPLVLFTAGARLLPMTTTGILFYITPSMQFLLGVFVFHEVINKHQIIGFSGIWLGLALYTYSLLENHKDYLK